MFCGHMTLELVDNAHEVDTYPNETFIKQFMLENKSEFDRLSFSDTRRTPVSCSAGNIYSRIKGTRLNNWESVVDHMCMVMAAGSIRYLCRHCAAVSTVMTN